MTKKKSNTKKQNGKPNGKRNSKPEAPKVAPTKAGTIAFTAYPEHVAAVDVLAARDGLTRSAAARKLIEKGRTAMRLRVPE